MKKNLTEYKISKEDEELGFSYRIKQVVKSNGESRFFPQYKRKGYFMNKDGNTYEYKFEDFESNMLYDYISKETAENALKKLIGTETKKTIYHDIVV